jgi:DNA modification methylase
MKYIRTKHTGVCCSGTTGVAEKNLGRKAVLIEREENYCATAKKRIEDTKKQDGFFALVK